MTRSCKSAGAHTFTFTEKLGTYEGSENNSVESRSQSMQGHLSFEKAVNFPDAATHHVNMGRSHRLHGRLCIPIKRASTPDAEE